MSCYLKFKSILNGIKIFNHSKIKNKWNFLKTWIYNSKFHCRNSYFEKQVQIFQVIKVGVALSTFEWINICSTRNINVCINENVLGWLTFDHRITFLNVISKRKINMKNNLSFLESQVFACCCSLPSKFCLKPIVIFRMLYVLCRWKAVRNMKPCTLYLLKILFLIAYIFCLSNSSV